MKLFLGDCLDVLPTLEASSIDLILTDLPYGTTQNKWDSVIPLDRLWAEFRRVRKPTAVTALFGAQPFTSALVMSNPTEFKYDWCWKKPKGTGHLNAKKQPMRDKEDILIFYRGQAIYNPQMTAGTPFRNKAGDPAKSTSMTENYGKYTNYREDNEGTRYPKQVLEFGVVERGTVHPTQKPVPLLRYMIRTYTNPGMVVLDATMGSGSTGMACLLEDRDFVGIEKEAKYFDTANRSLAFVKETL